MKSFLFLQMGGHCPPNEEGQYRKKYCYHGSSGDSDSDGRLMVYAPPGEDVSCSQRTNRK